MECLYLLLFIALSIGANFDLRLVSRELKKDAPWSLEGSAQNLRSDVKHELQQIMNQFVLLWPEATWAKSQGPSAESIRQSLQKLTQYLQDEKRAEQVKQVKVSIDYILSYLSQVEQKIAQADLNALSADLQQLLEQKKELFGQLKMALQEGRAVLG